MISLATRYAPVIVILLTGAGCKKSSSDSKSGSPENTPPPAEEGGNTTGTVEIKTDPNEEVGDDKKDDKKSGDLNPEVSSGAAHPVVVSGSVALDIAALTTMPTPTTVLAINAAGDRIEGTFNPDDNSYAVTLDGAADSNYTVLLIDETKTGSDMVVGKFKSGALNSLAVNEQSDATLDLGEATLADAGSGQLPDIVADNALTNVLTATKLSAEESDTYGGYDDAILKNINVDVDGDGELDAKGDYSLEFGVAFSAAADPNQGAPVSTYENQFLDEQTGPDAFTDFNQGRSTISLYARRGLFEAAPTVVRWTFDEDVEIDDTGSEMKVYADLANPTVYPMGGKFTVPANTPVERAFEVPNDPDAGNQTYNFGIMLTAIPQGGLKIEVGGKTLQYKNIKVANYNSTPAVVPFLRINTSNNLITSIQYKWMTRNADNTDWVLATERLTSLFVGKSGGYFSMYVMDGTTRLQRRLELAIKPDVMEATIPFDADHACVGDAAPDSGQGCSDEDNGVKLRLTGFPTLQDAFGQKLLATPGAGETTWGWNNFTFTDKLGMGISVN